MSLFPCRFGRSWGVAGLLVAAGLMALGPEALAQAGARTGGEDGAPVEVRSDNGIEWRREEQIYVARGNAVAIQGEDRVRADVLSAYYRETADGGTEIWRMEARGGARIETPGQVATGGSAVYDLDSGVLVMREAPLRLETETETVTATDSLEYWSRERMAVARGEARLVRADGDTIDADVLTGYFAPETADDRGAAAVPADDPGGVRPGASGLRRLEAHGGVVITTAREVVRGERAVYDVPAGIATVVGDVTVSTDSDQLAGERAVMNLKTGVSTLTGGSGEDGDGRARALIRSGESGRSGRGSGE